MKLLISWYGKAANAQSDRVVLEAIVYEVGRAESFAVRDVDPCVAKPLLQRNVDRCWSGPSECFPKTRTCQVVEKVVAGTFISAAEKHFNRTAS